MKPNFLYLAALAAAMLVPAGAPAQEGLARNAGDPAHAQVLASTFNIDQGRVLGMRRQLGMPWNDIEQALTIARAVTNAEAKVTMDAALNRVLSVRAMGQEWPAIAQQFGATQPVVKAAKASTQRPAVTRPAITNAVVAPAPTPMVTDKGSRAMQIRAAAANRTSIKSPEPVKSTSPSR